MFRWNISTQGAPKEQMSCWLPQFHHSKL
uniref:Uncharacterized protein n=1 Tax=Arundo donax TaxID=35708 RepID=A0A0A8ZBX3_ARUDO